MKSKIPQIDCRSQLLDIRSGESKLLSIGGNYMHNQYQQSVKVSSRDLHWTDFSASGYERPTLNLHGQAAITINAASIESTGKSLRKLNLRCT